MFQQASCRCWQNCSRTVSHNVFGADGAWGGVVRAVKDDKILPVLTYYERSRYCIENIYLVRAIDTHHFVPKYKDRLE